jgi:phosphatidylglycerol:prolipoprotein diacylglycerol transferase
MTFPVYLHIVGWRVHPHPVMEVIAYTAGFQLFLQLRRRNSFPAAAPSLEDGLWLLVACICGAAVGSKLLAWAESAPLYFHQSPGILLLAEGKTIVGGLLGGWAGVEFAKRRLGIRHSTGDAFVFPLILGMAIGRIGCFLTGLDDHTCGLPTDLPWGVNFGDGIPRHPAQLCDICFLVLLAIALAIWRSRKTLANGRLFTIFMLSYLLYRFGIEFIKPRWTPLGGLSMIQAASLIGAIICIVRVRQLSQAEFRKSTPAGVQVREPERNDHD